MSFRAETIYPGVWHIADAMDVCMTLVAGQRGAVLIDAGYGLEDVRSFVSSLAGFEPRLLLTHGHHDHALGARWFDRVWLHPDDFPVYRAYTAPAQRKLVLLNAKAREVPADEETFLQASLPEPEPLADAAIDLGGLTVVPVLCPGHTPGSTVFYVPEYRLLLTGDDWNPTTWLFFREALPVGDYLRNMRALTAACPFTHALCSHQRVLYLRQKVEAFLDGLTPERLGAAEPCGEGGARGIRTGRCEPAEGQQLVFDLDKLRKGDCI